MQVNKNRRKRPPFSLIFLIGNGAPSTRIKMLQQKLIHLSARRKHLQQNFMNIRYRWVFPSSMNPTFRT
jgi:hypothetical protein